MDWQIFASFLLSLYADLIKFYHSFFFSVVKFLLGIYSIIVFVDIILLLVHRGVSGNLRETLTGMNIPKELTSKKKKTRAMWAKIRQRLESVNEAEYKLAVIEADDIIDELVKGLGYKGDNFGERLDNIPDAQIENIEGMKQAHEMRNRIIHDENLVVTREDADGTLSHYEEFLRSFQVLD